MSEPEAKQLSRQETRELVRNILVGVDEKPWFIDGVVKLSHLPWVKVKVDQRKYRKALFDATDQAMKVGIKLENLERGKSLVDRIHQVWRDLHQSETESVSPSAIRQRLIEEGVISEPAPKPVVAKTEPREPMTNPFPLRAGSRPYG